MNRAVLQQDMPDKDTSDHAASLEHMGRADGILPDQKAWNGIHAFFENYINLQPSDYVILCYTPEVREPSAWLLAALAARGVAYDTLPMAPLHDEAFAGILQANVPGADMLEGNLYILMLEAETMSHNEAVRAAVRHIPPEKCRVVRIINAGRDLFAIGLLPTPEELSMRNAAILNRCRGIEHMRITTAGGTDLQVRLDQEKFRWISNRGMPDPGKFLVLPCGEVATYPAAIEGHLVADFAMNVNTGFRQDSRLNAAPVHLEIKNNRMIQFECDNPVIRDFLERSFARENADRVGELGLGTNFAVSEPAYQNSHLNERSPGIHLGFGQHNQTVSTTGYFCDIHIDLICRGGFLHFEDGEPPINLEKLEPTCAPHPELVQGEDVFSPDEMEDDCCGLLR